MTRDCSKSRWKTATSFSKRLGADKQLICENEIRIVPEKRINERWVAERRASREEFMVGPAPRRSSWGIKRKHSAEARGCQRDSNQFKLVLQREYSMEVNLMRESEKK